MSTGRGNQDGSFNGGDAIGWLLLLTSGFVVVVGDHDKVCDMEEKHPHNGALLELLLEKRGSCRNCGERGSIG